MLVVSIALCALFPPAARASTHLPPQLVARAGDQAVGGLGYVATFQLSKHTQVFTARRHVFAFALEGRGFSTTSYYAGARVTAGGVEADFGSLGRISVKFVPKGKPTGVDPPKGCRGNPQEVRKGAFVGEVAIGGSPGFPRFVDRSFRAKGSMTFWPRWRCRDEKEPVQPPAKDGKGVLLTADACDGRTLAVLGQRPVVDVFPDERMVAISAGAAERRGPVLIEQATVMFAKPKSFVFDEPLSTATVQPPPPFHGTATLTEEASGSVRWSGSLSVDLPGRRVPMAGPAFTAQLGSFPLAGGAGLFTAAVKPCRSDLSAGTP